MASGRKATPTSGARSLDMLQGIVTAFLVRSLQSCCRTTISLHGRKHRLYLSGRDTSQTGVDQPRARGERAVHVAQ